MRSDLFSYLPLATIFIALLTMIAFGAVLAFDYELGAQSEFADSSAQLLEAGTGARPSCLGYSLGDPCITRKNLAQCRAAVAKCGDEPVAVLESCPLQFRCDR